MRGTHPALPLAVNSRIQDILEKQSLKRNIELSFRQRLLIILEGIEGKGKYNTSNEFGLKMVSSLMLISKDLSTIFLIFFTICHKSIYPCDIVSQGCPRL